jgi:hypothetical protein
MTIDQHYHKVYAPGARGQIWNPEFVFDQRDNGAATITLHADSPQDGLFITIALNTDTDVSLDPMQIVLDDNGVSHVSHNGKVVAQANGARFPRGKPAHVWFRFNHGRIWVGFGNKVGQNVVMSGDARDCELLGGGYLRFAVGKTGNNGAFELLDVAPLMLRVAKRLPW